MRNKYLALFLTLALACSLLAGCGGTQSAPRTAEPDGPKQQSEVSVDGGAKDNSDPNAPKTIRSTEITEFACHFSTEAAVEPGALGNHVYDFSAKLENGAVTGGYETRDGGVRRELRPDGAFDPDFMGELFALVDSYELARFNGHSYEVSGLPDNFGATLDVRFASGESICAYDNQDCFLPAGFLSELLRLFERGTAAAPEVLDFSVKTEYRMEELDGGFASVQYPVCALGYRTPDGEPVLPDGYDGLGRAIDSFNAESERRAGEAWESFGKASSERPLYCNTEVFVTRADSEALSFYERVSRFEDASQDYDLTEIRAHNFDAGTGEELRWEDVFRDMEYLPDLLAMTFEQAYPDLAFHNDMPDEIRRSVESGDGGVGFALGYGCVHVFASEFELCDEPYSLHTTLSCVLRPDQVRAYYTTMPERWVMPLDYGVTYWPNDVSLGFRMDCREEPGTAGVLWTVTLDGGDAEPYEEPLYGYAPRCWLVHTGGRNFIYQNVPTGDVSMLADVYEVRGDGVEKLCGKPLELAVRDDTTLDPDRLLMNFNKPVFSRSVQLLPYAAYRVDDEGSPEMDGSVFGLDGPWVRLREGGRYNPDSRENAAVSGGMWTLIAGERVRPCQTDMATFLDFITEDGRVIRFGIERFADDMTLDNFGTLDDVFMQEAAG